MPKMFIWNSMVDYVGSLLITGQTAKGSINKPDG